MAQVSRSWYIYSWLKKIQSFTENVLEVRSGLLNSYSFDGIVCDTSVGPDTKNIFKMQAQSFSLVSFLIVHSCTLKLQSNISSNLSLYIPH